MRHSTLVAAAAAAAACGLSLTLAAQAPRAGSQKRAAARQLTNPVPADDASLDLGRRIYIGECAACHGLYGDGDSKMQYQLDPVPPSLVDAEWKYGSTDGEIFVVIRDGIDDTTMRPYAEMLSEPQMWSVVNYIRSIAEAPPQP